VRANGCNWKYPYNTLETCEDLNGSRQKLVTWKGLKEMEIEAEEDKCEAISQFKRVGEIPI